MIGELSNDQIDQVLHLTMVGRLGIIDASRPYVVPVAYAYDGKYIYCHSKDGLKIKCMRKNPNVCFEVDIIDNINSWRSVLIYGKYEELKTGKDRTTAVNLLSSRLNPVLITNIAYQPARTFDPPRVVEKKQQAIYYRIRIAEKTGRFQKPNS